MENKPRLIGVTGGIGSGKTTICKIFETLGHTVYYADDRAKWLMANEATLKKEITDLFGDDAYQNGNLNREYLGKASFDDPSLLKKLNSLVHPAVGRDVKAWVAKNSSEELLFKEAALLFEIGTYKSLEATVLVTAPVETRVKRVLKRDPQRTSESVMKIINQQMPDEEKQTLADFTIQNDGSKSIIKQTLEVYNKLLV